MKFLKWLPLTVLFILAILFEPLRSGFVLADQSCEVITDWERVRNSIFNRRHVISFGILCLVAATTFRKYRVVKAVVAVFLFSAFLEYEQSFFATGHCRAWDLIPNVLGVGLAAAIFLCGQWVLRRINERKTAR